MVELSISARSHARPLNDLQHGLSCKQMTVKVDFVGKSCTFSDMRSALPAGLFVVVAASMTSQAQTVANLVWEVNDGSGWRSGSVITTSSSLTVRLVASWNSTAIFEQTAFDAIITSPGATSDGASGFYYHPWLSFDGASFAATRFGNVLKIDRTGDAAPPGQGFSWINPYQEVGVAERLTDNPLEIFRYTLLLDTSVTGERVLSQIHSPLRNRPGSQNPGHFVSVATGNSPVAIFTNTPTTTIQYIPAPTTGSAAILGCLFMTRCRR